MFVRRIQIFICESVPEPLPLAVLCEAASHAVRVGPRQRRVVTDRLAEPEQGYECPNAIRMGNCR